MHAVPVSPAILGPMLVAAGAWLLWALASARLARNNPRLEPVAGAFMFMLRLYARLVHRLRIEGREHIPRSRTPGPLIVVANHTAGIDPILVQVACPFEVKWLMARDMMIQGAAGPWAAAEELWEFTGVIPVNRDDSRGDATAARAALAHLKAGGIVGVFPEGAIARPRATILPFNPGVGLLARRSGAPVLQVVIDGTPDRPTAWGSLARPSRSRLRFLPPKTFTAAEAPEAVAKALEDRLVDATGWPRAERQA
ncbi:MAG: 1-acyl-sn-glycerol-3-phosphate acyltransferase [Phycisphaeraceae bacterium]|nr:1-acyl-sn-glycerol-3-phosphate acyltransferase [Phycisphaeraceae bacterium]